MNLKYLFNKLFSYTPSSDYQFILSENNQNQENNSNYNSFSEKVNIFPNINDNIEHMKTKYNLMINSDIILREFTLNARGKQYNAFLFYIDGLADAQLMDDFILKPLMLRNNNNLQNKIISESVTNNITIRKVKKFDLPNYLMGCLLPQNDVKEITDFDEAANAINSRKLCIIY